MTDTFEPAEFDAWAARYDVDVATDGIFPFDGYARVLQAVVDLAAPGPGAAVLDLGIGTGNLALPFARLGCEIWGLDFSAQMLALARDKIPDAILGQADMRDLSWPLAFRRRFECIVSAYTFHHFALDEKIRLVKRLLDEYLLPGGRLLIADIVFHDAAEWVQLGNRNTIGWQTKLWLPALQSISPPGS